jgi:hypothetical protein
MSDFNNFSEYSGPEGFIYVAHNQYMHDVIKIGLTKKSPYARLNELKTTGVLGDFELIVAYYVKDCAASEKHLHQIYNEIRVQNNREFFKVSREKYFTFAVDCGLILAKSKMIDPKIYFGIFSNANHKNMDTEQKINDLEKEIIELKKLLNEKDKYISKTIHNVG